MRHPFQVGNIYINEKGAFEVVWLDQTKDSMLIRYLGRGREQRTSISFQARVQARRSLEEQETARYAAEQDARYQRGYGEAFTGLKASDFKLFTKSTTRRSRKDLAGLVCKKASQNTLYTFVSWAIYRWPVAFLTHRDDYAMAAFEMGSRKAKFTLEIDECYLYYGFYPKEQRADGSRVGLAAPDPKVEIGRGSGPGGNASRSPAWGAFPWPNVKGERALSLCQWTGDGGPFPMG